VPSLTLLLVVFVVLVLAIVPTRRLSRAGWPPAVLLVYLLALMGLALVAIELRGPLRLMIPLVVLLYLLPFAVPPELLARLVRRRAGGPTDPPQAPRNVTPAGSNARVVDPPKLTVGRPPAAPRVTPEDGSTVPDDSTVQDGPGS
jgi:hypothetical protein